MTTAEKYKVWDRVDRALHNALLGLDVDTLRWLANETETTTIVQDKARNMLDYTDPFFRARTDGISASEATRTVAREIAEHRDAVEAARKIAERGSLLAESKATLVHIARLAATS